MVTRPQGSQKPRRGQRSRSGHCPRGKVRLEVDVGCSAMSEDHSADEPKDRSDSFNDSSSRTHSEIYTSGDQELALDPSTPMTDRLSRRNILSKMAVAGVSLSGVRAIIGPVAGSSPTSTNSGVVDTIEKSEPYEKVTGRIRDDGYILPSGKEGAPLVIRTGEGSLLYPDKPDGHLVIFPFEMRGPSTKPAKVRAFLRENNDFLEIGVGTGDLNHEDGIGDNISRHHFSDSNISGQYDGMINWRYVDHPDLQEPGQVATSNVRAAQHIPLPGYDYFGTYGLDDICYVVAGACFGLFLATLADLIPGDEVFVGIGCGIAGGVCFIIETVKRFTSCTDPAVVLYNQKWWNPVGPPFIGYPTC